MALEYGYLHSVRHQAKKSMELINAICANFGKRIVWNPRTGYHYIERDGHIIYFRRRGNKYANWIELLSYDIDVLRRIKAVFMQDFRADVEIKQGEL